ncbi:phospho-sugar mutase [Clostridium sp. D2Q-11]|uniref:Phosphoglucomutase n=1 Tax=Anaeromonas frigoriresistens TaxID=2683708 RepID=A0A942UVR9_9FIRM|nr:phospho-sugar mutase [Anaeromonas frigoriresistens]MBS4537709.1 phospho-sugar mutase [Anaeromonas frigoriresistens]
MDYIKKYEKWISNENIDKITKDELMKIKDDKEEIEERFYTDLSFGTAGLRGKMGAGTNRMNKYIISMATQAIAEVIKAEGKKACKKGVVIAYDVRHKSDEFAKRAALVLANNGIKAYLFEGIRPTPELSYAVRRLGTQAGIVVTASHNPKDYNGYKVYWDEGSQILSDIAARVTEKIDEIEDIAKIKRMDEDEALREGLLEIIGKDIDDEYIEKVKELSLRDEIKKDIKIVYTPFNGTGNIPVRRVLDERGFNNVFVVKEQENPDPNFTTIGYPNPEDIKTFEYAIKLGKEKNADLLIANDPDCDRMACMIKDKKGEYIPLNGNQTGAILINYVLEALKEKNEIPSNAVIVKSIVTGDLGKDIAKSYGVHTVETLTGFKNICGKANEFEKTGEYTYLFGYEESIGYVYDTFVRDKDGVIAAMLIVEAAAFYMNKEKTLLDILEDIYNEYGYYSEDLFSLVLEGIEGKERIGRMMENYKKHYLTEIAGAKLTRITDFENQLRRDLLNESEEEIEMKKTNALKFEFDNDSWYAIRPSGTEPKIKIYIYSKGKNKSEAEEIVKKIKENVLDKLHSIK